MSDETPAITVLAGEPAIRPKQHVPGRFQPGQSGNPSGRPAVSRRIREEAQKHGDDAIRGLLELARDHATPPAVRRAAWSDILDRGFGRPTVGEPDDDGRQAGTLRLTWGDGSE